MKIKVFITVIIISLTTSLILTAQNKGYKASLTESGEIQIDKIQIKAQVENKLALTPKSGFPMGAPANPSFKNFRGAAIADIDDDGADEIIFGAYSTLFAVKGNGDILWSRLLSGTIVYPPSVADMDGDESLEIIVNTGGVPDAGRVYLLDNLGNDLDGWPQNFNQHWMFNAPAISDLNGDGIQEVITCERGNSSSGFLHVINLDGSPFGVNWPVELPGNLAFTPSIGDIDNDGSPNIVISISSGSLYALNPDGSILDGFPVVETNRGFSYQSPILHDLDGNGTLEIIGARHGDVSDYYVVESDGTYKDGWPITTPTGWRYSPATVVHGMFDENDIGIFFGHPNTDGVNPMDVIFGYAPDGSLLDGFPISKIGGCESVITVADINADGVKDLVFTDNMTDANGIGYIHAYSIDGSGELEGFPVRPKGFTFMNSAVVGDIDGDDVLDLACISYTQFTGNDSIFLTAYDLGVPVNESNVLFNGYKGNQLRDGILHTATGVGIHHPMVNQLWLEISPNPSQNILKINYPNFEKSLRVDIINYMGQVIKSYQVEGQNEIILSAEDLQAGYYLIRLKSEKMEISRKWLKI